MDRYRYRGLTADGHMIYGTACGNVITDINGRSHTVTACVQLTGFRDFRGYEIYEDDLLTCGGVVLRPFFSDTENMWILTDSACSLRPDQILPLSRRIIAMFRLRILHVRRWHVIPGHGPESTPGHGPESGYINK